MYSVTTNLSEDRMVIKSALRAFSAERISLKEDLCGAIAAAGDNLTPATVAPLMRRLRLANAAAELADRLAELVAAAAATETQGYEGGLGALPDEAGKRLAVAMAALALDTERTLEGAR